MLQKILVLKLFTNRVQPFRTQNMIDCCSVGRFWVQHQSDQSLKTRRHRWLRWPGDFSNKFSSVIWKRRFPVDHQIKDHAQRVDVYRFGGIVTVVDFGCHVASSTARCGEYLRPVSCADHCQREIYDNWDSSSSPVAVVDGFEEYVFGFQVAVGYVFFVEVEKEFEKST